MDIDPIIMDNHNIIQDDSDLNEMDKNPIIMNHTERDLNSGGISDGEDVNDYFNKELETNGKFIRDLGSEAVINPFSSTSSGKELFRSDVDCLGFN